jgi:hypothetical protein
MADLIGVRVYAPPDYADHAMVSRSGRLYYFAVSEPQYLVGGVRDEMIGFPGGAWVPASGVVGRTPEGKTFDLYVDEKPYNNRQHRLDALERALPLATELHRPNGLYLDLWSAQSEDRSDAEGRITVLFKPKSELWRHPLLDDANDDAKASVFYAQESGGNATTPIIITTPASRLTAPLLVNHMTQGSMFVGVSSLATGVYGIAGLGSPIGPDGAPKANSISLYYSNGVYRAQVGSVVASALQDDVGGFGTLKCFAFTWRENGQLTLYSYSSAGFKVQPSPVLGLVEPFMVPQSHMGILSNFNSVDGYFMPGAPSLGPIGAPFFSPRVFTLPEVEATLKAQYEYYTQWPTFTVKPPPYGLDLTIGDVPEMVAGRTYDVPLSVLKEGGYTGGIEFVVSSSDISLRTGEPYQQSDEESNDWFLPVTPEEGLATGSYSIGVTARAVGQTTSELLVGVIDTEEFSVTVRLGDPALADGMTRFNSLYDPKNKSFTTMWQNALASATITGGVLVTRGLARQTARWDGLWGDGTNFSQWGGAAVVTSDDYVANMAADHTVQVAVADANLFAAGSVLFTIASQTNKFQYYQVYVASNGIRVRTSMGTASPSLVEPTNALPILTGIMDIAVTVDVDGLLTLLNPKTGDTVTTQARGWAGAGRLTCFGARLSDGATQGLSKANVLNIASGPVIPSIFQLERQAEYFRGFMLRTAAYARPEYPPATCGIWLADPGGALRNYHPATSSHTMISKGTGATTSGGSFLSDGAAETGWRSGWITGSNAAQPYDFFFTFKDMSATGGNNLTKFGVQLYEKANSYSRTSPNGDTTRRLMTNINIDGETSFTYTDRPGTVTDAKMLMTGVQTYMQRNNPSAKTIRIEHVDSGVGISNSYASWTMTGLLQASVGATYRGLQSDGTIRGETSTGLEFEVQVNCLGILMVAKNTTEAEQQAAITNLTGTFDYSNVLYPGGGTGGGGGGGGGGTVVISPTDMTMVALATADWSADTLFGTTGEQRTRWDRLQTWLTNGGASQTNPPYFHDWKNTNQTYRGQYRFARGLNNYGLALCFATAASKNLAFPRQAKVFWDRCNSLLNLEGSPESTANGVYKGWAYGTNGQGKLVGPEGKRIMLEAGISASAMVIAYLLNKNKHLDSTFQSSINSLLDWYDNHLRPEWDGYWGVQNVTMRDRPLNAKRNFTHANLGELVALFCRAVIRSGSLWYNDPDGVEALDAWGLWYQTNTTQVIPTANFKDAAWASYGPARLWGQRCIGWGVTAGQFTQPTTYLSETWPDLLFLYMEGFLTRALGTQAAADTFMTECVSGANLGVFIEPLRALKRYPYYMNGWYATSSTTSESWMYTTNPMGATSTEYEIAATALKTSAFALAPLDSSGRLGAIHDEWHAASTDAKNANKQYFPGNTMHFFTHIYRNGRNG